MLYYYNQDGKFQKESSREYKTEKGAVDRVLKEGQGAAFDETGNLIFALVDKGDVPEGALDTNVDGSVPAFNDDNEQIGTVDAETAAEAVGESVNTTETSEGETGRQEQNNPDILAFDGMEELAEKYKKREPEQADKASFVIQTTCDALRIRSGAGKDHRIVGYIREKAGKKENHAIVEEKNGWGRLASGEGWIELAFTKKVN